MSASHNACAPQTRRLPHWKADQRGVDRGSTESVPRHRYVISSSGDLPCERSDGVRRRGERTRCFADGDSHRRKTCRILLPEGGFAPRIPIGMHLSGVHALRGVGFSCSYRDVFENRSFVVRDTDDIDAYAVTVLGPCRHVVTGRMQVLCAATNNFAYIADPDNLSGVFLASVSWTERRGSTNKKHHQEVRYAPTLDMLRAWLRRLADAEVAGGLPEDVQGVTTAMRPVVDQLARRFALLRELRRRCESDATLQKRARAVVRNVFSMAMYARRWQGPGTPYPVSWVGFVGTSARRVSESLVGKEVAVTAAGEVRLTAGGGGRDLAAEYVNGEGRLEHMEARHLGAAVKVLEEHPILRTNMLACMETTYVVDGTQWPSGETLQDVLDLVCRGLTTDTRSCMRRNSLHLIRTCHMLVPYVYKSEPTWIKYEGFLSMYDNETRVTRV